MNQPLAYVHPGAKIGKNVVVEPFSTINNNVEIGEGARVGASSVVLHDVPARVSVAGVPAKIVGQVEHGEMPYLGMDHSISSSPNYENGGGI